MRFRYLHQKTGDSRRKTSPLFGATLALGTAFCYAGPLAAAPTSGSDPSGPKVVILQPSYQDVLKGTTSILLAVETTKFNAQYVEMFVDDNSQTKGAIPLSAYSSSKFNFDTKLLTDGPHTLMVRVTDTQGFRGWAEVLIYVNNLNKRDEIPPQLDWLNIQPGQILSGKVNFQLQAVDNFGIQYILVSVNPASTPEKKPPSRSWLLNRPPYNFDLDTTLEPDGMYVLQAKAWDSKEQEGQTTPLFFGISNHAINATRLADELEKLNRSQQDAPPQKPKTPNKTTRTGPDVNIVVPEVQPTPQDPSYNSGNSQPPVIKNPNLVGIIPPPKAGNGDGLNQVTPNQPVTPTQPPQIVKVLPPQPVVPPTPSANALSGLQPRQYKGALTPSSRATIETPKTFDSTPSKASTPNFGSRKLPAPQTNATANIKPNQPPTETGNQTRIASNQNRTSDLTPSALSTTNPARPEIRTPQNPALSGANPSHVSTLPTLPATRVEQLPVEKVELGGESGRLSVPLQTENRATKIPTLSASQNKDASTVVTHEPVIATPEDQNRDPRVAAPNEILVAATPTAKSNRVPILSSVVEKTQTWSAGRVLPEMAAPSNQEPSRASLPRFSALPRTEKTGEKAAISAITVSPLSLAASTALPAFHFAAKATSVKAIAAYYKMPADLIAACNELESDQIAAGTRVKLPQPLQVSYQGKPIKGDVASLMIGSTSVTAFRFLFQEQGGTLEWDAKNHKVLAKKGDQNVVLTIGSRAAQINDKEVMMELAAFLMEGRTMVPVRLFEQGFNASVEWEPETGRLYVAMAN